MRSGVFEVPEGVARAARVAAWALAHTVELGLWSLRAGDRVDGERLVACARLLT